jgi:drug/metabolite transporter (DMT)-like permease
LVSVANLSQVLFAGGLAYLILGEVPDSVFYPSAALIVAGAVLAVTKASERKKKCKQGR